jgi:NAD(P)-dependent dehydrogenase (short-subunit alcohol dehydrogenase family)
LARIGVRPIALGRRRDETELIARETGGLPVHADLADTQALSIAVAALAPVGGAIESAFLVASPPPLLQQIGRVQDADFEHFLRVNVTANQVILKQLLALAFRTKRAGHVVGVLSEAAGLPGALPSSLFGAYAVSKAAFAALLDQYRADYPWLSVRQVRLGLVDTPMLMAFEPRVLEKLEEGRPRISAAEAATRIVREVYSDEL